MKGKFLISLLLLSFHFSFAQQSTSIDWRKAIGSNITSIDKRYNRSNYTMKDWFVYDDSTALLYVTKDCFYQVFCFKDKIFRVHRIIDGSLWGEDSKLDTTYHDKTAEARFEIYFLTKYGRKPDYNSAEASRIVLWDAFATHCGGTGGARGKGVEYLEKEKTGICNDSLCQYLLSFSPQDRLVGVLLFDPNKNKELENIYIQVKTTSSEYSFHFCNSCEGTKYTPLREILEDYKP